AAGPTIADRRRVRTAIRREPDGIFSLGIEIGWQEQAAFKRGAALSRNFYQLILAPAVLFERMNGVGVERADERAVRGVEVNLRRPRVVAVRVNEEIAFGTYQAAVIAGAIGEALKAAAIELDAIEIAGQMTVA